MAPRPIFYDTETTGTSPEEDHIIEIAAYDPEKEESFQALIHPPSPIPKGATEIHHITNEMVADCPPFSVIGQKFQHFCQGDVVLIAHNNDSFDQPLLENNFRRHHLSLPPWKFIDSLKWARRYRPDLPRHSLQYLREAYGIPPNTAHRALDDVKILYKVFSLLVDDLPIDKILSLLEKEDQLSIMPFGKHRGTPLSEIPLNYFKWLKQQGALEKAENLPLKKGLEHLGLLSKLS